MTDPTMTTAMPPVRLPAAPPAQASTSSELILSLNAIEQNQQEQADLLDRLSRQVAVIADRPLKITNFDMPFFALVGFIVKVAIASIPAALIIAVLYLVFFVTFGGAILSALRP